MNLPSQTAGKRSRADWIGILPSHWDEVRLKHGLRLVTEKASEDTFKVALENIESWSGRYIETETVFEGDGTAFQRGDLLFGKLRPYLAKALLVDAPGQAVGDFHVLRPTAEVLGRFALYYVLSRDFIAVVDGSTYGAKMPRASWDFMANLPLPLPPPSEQVAIATFLDHETGKIDALVEEQRRLIELLKEKRQTIITRAVTKGLDPNAKMKPSGVEWLGDVPEHWKVRRLGTLFSEIAEPGNGDLPIFSVSIHHGVSDTELDDEELDRKVSRSEDKSKYKRVQPHDLVYNMMRAWQGGFGSVQAVGMVSPAYVVARPKTELSTVYIEALLRTPKAVEEMRRRSRGVTDFRLRLYWDEFKDMSVALPPPEEQNDITRVVAAADAQAGALMSESSVLVDLLQEHRSALIAAAVTGKIDVREATTDQEDAA